MVTWVEWAALVLSLAVGVVAVSLFLFSKRNLPTILLAAFLFAWGIVGALFAWTIGGLEVENPIGMGVWIIVFSLYNVALISFAVVYPNLALSRRNLFVIAAALLVFLAFLISAATRTWSLAHLTGLFDASFLFSQVSGLVGVGFLGARWIRAKTSAYRMQVLWGLLVFVFWSLHHAFMAIVVYPAQFGGSILSLGQWPWVWIAVAWVSVLAGAVSLTLILYALFRFVKGHFDSSDRALVLLAPFMLAATTLQVYMVELHILLDYLAAAFVIYGVLRFNVVDLDLKIKWGVKHSTVAAAFVAAFFVVSEAAKVFFEGALGSTLLGILAAGTLVFAIAPLQRMGATISNRMLPAVSGGDDYSAYRRFQIYRVALEGALQDGVLNSRETSALRNLRSELGLTEKDHEQLEIEVLNRLEQSTAKT